ncbi:MAG: cache domain-containing protein [Burkholderiales bacterium]|nr:cache domain-containing protein [Burkholderiales bacterium]MBH2015439.1 cache domain-containing protein [Burkholderiales bacterium]
MPFTRRALVLASVLSLMSGLGLAQDRGSRDEAKAMTEAAYAHIKKVGPEKAYSDFTHDKANWNKKDLYVMVYNNAAINQAHGANPKLVGKDMSNVRDVNGVNLIPDMIKAAAKGGGWVDYDWPDPVTQKVMPKSTYARKQPNGEGFVGVGVYR